MPIRSCTETRQFVSINTVDDPTSSTPCANAGTDALLHTEQYANSTNHEMKSIDEAALCEH